MDEYREIHVVSDIHLGGKNGPDGNFQIFKYGDRLAAFIDHVAARRPGEDVALVLNGDIFDSLAEEDDVPGYVALTEDQAERLVARVVDDPSFQMVWRALCALLARPGGHIVFVIGNHDIELGLPIVQALLVDALVEGHPERASRVRFAATGGGYACSVGGARVFCTHGNEIDAMNRVDYNTLGQLANAMNASREIRTSRWRPNGGTRLVVDVMNTIKRQFPFVDIMKPTTHAVTAVLLAIDKDLFKKVNLSDAIPIGRAAASGQWAVSNLLGGDEAEEDADAPAPSSARTIQQIAGPRLGGAMAGQSPAEDELLARALSDPRDVPGDEAFDEDETLGIGHVIAGRLGLLPKDEALRLALLDWIEDQSEFDYADQDSTYRGMLGRVGPGVDCLVTGHTHRARAIDLPTGGHYFNSGTWIRTMRLTSEALEDAAYFRDELWPRLTSATLDELDQLQIPGPAGMQPVIDDRTHAVLISDNAGQVECELLRVRDAESGGGIEVAREEGTARRTVTKS